VAGGTSRPRHPPRRPDLDGVTLPVVERQSVEREAVACGPGAAAVVESTPPLSSTTAFGRASMSP
jgi:hypothetical protein